MLLKEEERNFIVGLLGTVAVHLIILIVFLIARLDKVRDVHQEPMVIEFDEQIYKDLEEILEAKKALSSEVKSLSQQDIKNIAVNTEGQVEEEISTEKYIEELKEELNIENINQQLDRSLPTDPIVESENKTQVKEIPQKKNYYTGPTRIKFSLKGRTERYIYVPVYKCQGEGKVVVDITVNQQGEVISTSLSSTDTDEACIIETALHSASISLFNIDLSADAKQRGTISYEFVPQ